jgi:feruloyl esterase
MRHTLVIACLALAVCIGAASPLGLSSSDDKSPCSALRRLQLVEARIVIAETVSAGRFDVENPEGMGPTSLVDVPRFCRVTGVASPAKGSVIGFEAWLPASGWNGKLLMLGNGGYSSSIPYPQMAEFLRRGYVTAATDTGHTGDDLIFGRGNPESIVDWGHRAVHVSRLFVGTLIGRHYGKSPQHAYFAGCSTGGHQALMSAQRYPEDFDGIIAGAPGHNRTHLNAGFLWQFLRNHAVDGQEIIRADKLATISAAVLTQCRANNGSRSGGLPTDPYLDDPLRCDFNLTSLACGTGDSEKCLSSEQMDVLKALYDGPRNPRSGDRI